MAPSSWPAAPMGSPSGCGTALISAPRSSSDPISPPPRRGSPLRSRVAVFRRTSAAFSPPAMTATPSSAARSTARAVVSCPADSSGPPMTTSSRTGTTTTSRRARPAALPVVSGVRSATTGTIPAACRSSATPTASPAMGPSSSAIRAARNASQELPRGSGLPAAAPPALNLRS